MDIFYTVSGVLFLPGGVFYTQKRRQFAKNLPFFFIFVMIDR